MLVRSLGGEDPLEKGMGSHSSILAWRNPWTEEPGGLQSIVSQRVGHDWSDLACNLQFQGRFIPISSRPFLRPVAAYVMNPWRRVWQTTPVATLQYSCLENPMDRGAWRATVHSVTKSQTWLKRLSPHSTMPILEIAFLFQLGMSKQKSSFFPESKKKQKEILLSIQVSYGSLVGS